MRSDGRKNDELRDVLIKRGYIKGPIGSAYIEMGNTKVVCTCSMENKVPQFAKEKGTGWLTAEYGMIPGSSSSRISRESAKGKITGRTAEIQRLIGRSLRSIVDLSQLGEITLYIDCDVIQADGGTRTAAITGGFVALMDGLYNLKNKDIIKSVPIKDYIAAVSVGIVDEKILLDLCYTEDSTAEVDMNVVMTSAGKFVEVQGTAENNPFTKEEMEKLISYASKGIKRLIDFQTDALKEVL